MAFVRVEYHPKDNVVDVDVTGVTPSPAVVDEAFDRIISAARKAREKPYIMTNWGNVELSIDAANRYGARMEELKPYIAGVVRYAVADSTRVQIRSEWIKHRLGTGQRTPFFETRAEALDAIRSGKIR